MPLYKITFGLVCGVYGPSESYISKSLTASTANATLNRLMDARNAMLHTSVQWTGVRIAQAPDPTKGFNDVTGRGEWDPPGSYDGFGGTAPLVVPGRGIYSGAEEADQPDQYRSCMQVRMRYDDSRSSIRYVSFIPDGVIRNEALGLNFGAYPSWSLRAGTFRQLLITDGWQIRARSRADEFSPFLISDWVQSDAVPGAIGFVLPNAPASGFKVKDRIQIKNTTRRGTDGVSYNATYRISGVNTTLITGSTVYYLRGTEAALAASIKELGTASKVGYAYYPIQATIPIRGGIHKRGKPLGSVRGRRSRARLRLA